MNPRAKNIAVFGSTGSIGVNALRVIAAAPGCLRAVALSAHSNTELALTQAIEHRPLWLVITDPRAAAAQDWSSLPPETELLTGREQLEAVISQGAASATRSERIDTVLAAIVGSAGLHSTWAAVQAGMTVALANKETLVLAGSLFMREAAKTGATILPVDSEHSAVFQCLQSGRRSELQRIILTASGGPFRNHTAEQLQSVTVDDALRHPNWQMGPKITIDSATMMNKALEIIEARWLFDLQPEQIDVVIHPQSIVHSLVEFIDGSVIAQLGPPDMKLPIQYALRYPERCEGIAPRLDFQETLRLDFSPPDHDRFPALELGLEAARVGGTVGAVLNAANEAAVGQFLAGELPFCDIVPACRRIIEQHQFESQPSLAQLLAIDGWARQEVTRWVHT
ncbi:MAG: 1-deoxy-D-xylulose-5-phosphate reductoisomerase [Planctomycetota bacterium]|nr:1-deoxy-D-xylulose-5-phosphate reductoisomerase [Planctomycetota bacterium]